MSEFEKGLRKARARQRGLYLLTVVFFLVGGIVVTGFLVLGKGTTIEVLPEEAAVNAALTLSKGYGL